MIDDKEISEDKPQTKIKYLPWLRIAILVLTPIGIFGFGILISMQIAETKP